ncbi:hypothetical protein COHA_007392 [Chlorella ohadii]|uniref:AB hydrolase-1 domain-containing protein n=1 Tax=Chlorella ohadii TaxID=2649997 RepID=A0AAD5GZU8_9CHLO|nr:hypothetical protein COHA_007392 [Chlorella ohadii]
MAAGFGYSDKRCPLHRREPLPAATSSGEAGLFTFHTWSRQLRAFIQEVVREPAVLLCNSAGGEVGLQAAIDDPSLVRAVQLFDISLRCQHEAKQAAWQRPFMAAAQRLLHETPLGLWYFAHLANRQTVRSLLCRCYGRPEAVTEELVESLVAPARQPGAAQVFLECICNSRGPLPEEQLQAVRVPVGIVWGEADPWERVELGRQLAQYPSGGQECKGRGCIVHLLVHA